MDIRNFIIELYTLFLGITLTVAIEKIVENFNYFSVICFILIFFLAIDFFFAKVKDIGHKSEGLTGLNLMLNLLVVGCFSFMPYFMTSFIGIMVVLVCLRIFDLLLILDESHWKRSNVNSQNRRWIIFDISYFLIELILLFIYCLLRSILVGNILITIYLILGLFESIFDFAINSSKYLKIE